MMAATASGKVSVAIGKATHENRLRYTFLSPAIIGCTSDKVVAVIKVDAVINLVGHSDKGTKAEGLHVFCLAQYRLRASNASDWWGAKFNVSNYSNYEIL